ncbi:T9SS type B sorting domain-containing protein [Spirosoma sp. HMF4905]|uniref:T9SS type B sorting domain-containing protein n=1 Tax=Spirosoma arboris TaxID=2682092 RepID=A0A7K1SN23_9BACT|nr:gliding motility-associated C-terminal domain-containing protein [Spirosoma arboris]MVM35199.1 T9SS type B sorting domain-containing protein [Spirosoma arboris]
MRFSTFQLLVWLFALSSPLVVLASHQVGGQIEMRAIGDVFGHFHITVTNYLEDGTRGAAIQQTTGVLGIFRQRDNVQMMSFTVRQTGTRVPIIYANEFCAAQRNLKFIVLTYEADIQLSPGNYNDTQGYYMSYQTRNRNAGINNISIPDQTGFTFYLEFPALVQNGQAFSNSSPHFGTINGEYVCIGDPFRLPFGGTDPDGDELRYSMVTPLNQQSTLTNAVSSGPYPDVTWLSGFGPDNAIPGSPPLSIDAQTGQLSVTATQLGLFVFAVKVEEYRNGIKIGEVRRDFQLLVIDCPPQTTPDPAVQILNMPKATKTTICQGDSAILKAAVDTSWNYQWRRDGINIPGATNPTLTVRLSGEYTLVVSQKVVCSKVGNSNILAITVIGNEAKVSTSGHLCATTGTVTLYATDDSNVTYQWYRDGQLLSSAPSVDSMKTNQPGKYWSVLTHKTLGCKANTDTATIARSTAVQAVIKSASGFNRICPNDSLRLDASGGISYNWQKDDTQVGSSSSQYVATEAATYVVIATDIFGCKGTSAPVEITQLAPVVVTFDSIPGVCGPNVPAYSLAGTPPGGEFAGPGVTGSEFSPKLAGIGNHTVTYTVKAAPECAGTVATRIAVVAPIPTIQLADSMTTYTGNTFTMNPVYTGNPNQFLWASATYLDSTTVANPTVRDIQKDITYTINVKNSTGCEAKDTIHITVYPRVYVPEAFSPNGDGLNDTWELFGIEAFPDAVVTIFNRWGEVIYSSGKGYTHPFDGTLNGTSLPVGLYAFTLHTVPQKPVIRGSLMLVR